MKYKIAFLIALLALMSCCAVSYTHLTLPTT